jgi:hypothetical protein
MNIFGYISNNITATFAGSNDDKNIPSLFALNVPSDKKLTIAGNILLISLACGKTTFIHYNSKKILNIYLEYTLISLTKPYLESIPI